MSACYYIDNSYRYCAVINRTSGSGCFSIFMHNKSDYVMDYYFSINVDGVNFNSPTFWSKVISDCLTKSDQWKAISISSSLESNISENDILPLASSSIVSEYHTLLEEEFGTSEYTGRLLASKNISGINFHLYEDLSFIVSERQQWVTNSVMSVSAIIIGFFVPVYISAALSIFVTLHGLYVPSGTEVGTHTVGGRWTRYVKRSDSSVWLTNSYRTIGFNGFYIESLNNPCDIDEDSRNVQYGPTQEYFESYNAQFTDAYNAYLG